LVSAPTCYQNQGHLTSVASEPATCWHCSAADFAIGTPRLVLLLAMLLLLLLLLLLLSRLLLRLLHYNCRCIW
jgi:hypothetical protein